VSVACCQVEVSAAGWSLVQRSPTECGELTYRALTRNYVIRIDPLENGMQTPKDVREKVKINKNIVQLLVNSTNIENSFIDGFVVCTKWLCYKGSTEI
jgi:hypothetical protein